MRTEKQGNKQIFYPSGHIDSVTAHDFQNELLQAIDPSAELVIDMRDVDYISSAGLRVFLRLRKSGYSPAITEVQADVFDIFQMTGFTEMFDIKKEFRTISIDGCEIIGKGYSGTVYRIDEDTIVKVYNSPDAMTMIEKEQRNAKRAFVKGIPTAISYDIVQVGDKTGTVFELLRATSFNNLVIRHPERLDEITGRYVDFLKTIHGIEMDAGVLPYAKDVYLGYLESAREYMPDDVYEKIREKISGYPVDNHAVHGDVQMKNVMLVDNEPMLIDMETLCMGQPEFELAGLYMTYQLFGEDDPGNSMDFLGITGDTSDRIWKDIFDLYYDGHSGEEKAELFKEIELLSVVYFLSIIVDSDGKDSDLGRIRIAKSVEKLKRAVT